MDDTLEISQEISLEKIIIEDKIYYRSNQESIYNRLGDLIDPSFCKFETFNSNTIKLKKQSIKEVNKQKEVKEKETTQKEAKETKTTQTTQTEERMNQLATENGYNFFTASLDLLVKDGVSFQKDGEDLSKEDLMKMAWGDFVPGKKVKKSTKGVKKSRPLSGYTYFGQQNKEKFNEEMGKLDEKPKFVSYVGSKWKELSKEDQESWTVKAKEAFEASKSDE